VPDFPPLFDGRAVASDAFEAAVSAASRGCDAGLLLYRPSPQAIDAALVLAPDVPLADAAAMLLVAGNGFADAFGALAPPEFALHLDWPGGFRVEGGRCGGLRAATTPCENDEIPGWLVIGIAVPIRRETAGEPGESPDETDLTSEGTGLAPDDLLSAWARHTLAGIARWEDQGIAPVHRDWTGRAWGLGQPRTVAAATGTRSGVFQGLDERGGILLKSEAGTALVPLTEVIERRRC
jgi:BirA family transcriptional regulator, biotin operon repressor / biotin---[acetyl-CoA-carboxylase] ligase